MGIQYRLELALVGLEILAEALNSGAVAPGCGKDQAPLLQIMDQGDVMLAPAAGGSINTDVAHLAVIFALTGLVNMVVDDPPQDWSVIRSWRAQLTTGMALASVSDSASNSSVNRLPGRVHGTATWVVLPQWLQGTRGTRAWM